MRWKVMYNVGAAPTRTSRSKRGYLTITDDELTVTAQEPVMMKLGEVKALDFTNELGKFHITVVGPFQLHLTPILFNLFGVFSIMLNSRNIAVYTELHRRLGGPGKCAKCNYDLRVSRGRCPDCGCERVRPWR